MSERTTKPTTAEERAYWRATSKLHTTARRLIDDIAERDATIAALTARAEAAERERDEAREVLGEASRDLRRISNLRAELERRARAVLSALPVSLGIYEREAGTAIRALAELLPASTPKRGSLPCVYCHGTGAECTRCDGTGTQPEGKKPCAVCGSYEHRRHHG